MAGFYRIVFPLHVYYAVCQQTTNAIRWWSTNDSKTVLPARRTADETPSGNVRWHFDSARRLFIRERIIALWTATTVLSPTPGYPDHPPSLRLDAKDSSSEDHQSHWHSGRHEKNTSGRMAEALWEGRSRTSRIYNRRSGQPRRTRRHTTGHFDAPSTSQGRLARSHGPGNTYHRLSPTFHKIVSEMTYNVSSGTLNTTIPYHHPLSTPSNMHRLKIHLFK